MTFWIHWQGADGGEGPHLGPFDHHQDAVRRITTDIRGFAADLEHGTGKAGEWAWDADQEVATLYRGDLNDIPLGRYVIEEVDDEETT